MRPARRWAVLAGVVPVLFSAATWVCVWGLVGGWFYLLLAAGLLAVRCWDPPAILGLRCRVRPVADHEAAVVLEALVPAEGLRGRHQPRVWIARPGVRRHGIIALTARDVAVQEQTVVALMQGSLDADEFCAAVVWALAVRTSEGRGAGHAAVEVFCLPASAVSRLLRPAGQLATWPLIRTCWALRGGVALIGLVQSAATEHAWAGVGARSSSHSATPIPAGHGAATPNSNKPATTRSPAQVLRESGCGC